MCRGICRAYARRSDKITCCPDLAYEIRRPGREMEMPSEVEDKASLSHGHPRLTSQIGNPPTPCSDRMVKVWLPEIACVRRAMLLHGLVGNKSTFASHLTLASPSRGISFSFFAGLSGRGLEWFSSTADPASQSRGEGAMPAQVSLFRVQSFPQLSCFPFASPALAPSRLFGLPASSFKLSLVICWT